MAKPLNLKILKRKRKKPKNDTVVPQATLIAKSGRQTCSVRQSFGAVGVWDPFQRMYMEQTFAIIKPHAVKSKLSGTIIDMVEASGFDIIEMKKITMNKAQAQVLYAEHQGKPFYDGLVSIMTASPLIVLKLQKENAVSAWRDLMGATNPANATPGTIRALFGKSLDENATHGSDSSVSAARELAIFFGN